jgi:hypothetical protein
MLEKGRFPPSKTMEGNPSCAKSGVPFPAIMTIPARGLPCPLDALVPTKIREDPQKSPFFVISHSGYFRCGEFWRGRKSSQNLSQLRNSKKRKQSFGGKNDGKPADAETRRWEKMSGRENNIHAKMKV